MWISDCGLRIEKLDDRSQTTEVRRQMTDDRSWNSEGRSNGWEARRPGSEEAGRLGGWEAITLESIYFSINPII